jgi:hypothetical protein
MDANFKAMRKELDSNLTKEQLARLKEMDERRQEMMRQERKRRDSDTTNIRNDRRRFPGDPERSTDRFGPRPHLPSEQDSARSPDSE